MSKLKYILLLLLAVILTALLFLYSSSAENKSMNLSDKVLLTDTAEYDGSFFVSDKKLKDLKKISSSGVLEMYLDESDLSVCILDTISGKLWRSLPASHTKENSANLSLDIILKGRVYTLNSQKDSVALGCASYEVRDDILTIAYSFRKSLDNGKEIDITVPVTFTLSDGTLSVDLDCSKINNTSTADIYISSLDILPFFGADTKAQKGDFILLPSSSGIILDTYTPTEAFDEIRLPVYGEDIAKNQAVTSYVPIGAFGMKNGNNAFLCLIDQGEALATIKAQKAVKDSSCNRVSAEFEITPTLITDDTIYLAKETYNGNISLSYRFLSGSNADYITMAGSCRELLIRQGRLRDSSDNDGSYPFNLTLISYSAEKGQVTSSDEAQELVTSLISKGIGDVNVILSGEEKPDISFLSEFSKNENVSLSLRSSLFSYNKKGTLTLSGDRSSADIKDIHKSTDSFINIMRKSGAGICLADSGKLLPSDYSKKGNTRNKLLADISKICTTLSSQGKLTLSSPNIYTVKYAHNIINIPESSPLENNPYCKSVPFLQAVLHGICDYSFTAVNLSSDPAKAMLKSIEYGAIPHYEWYFTQTDESDIYHYMTSLSEARLLYENMKNMFSDLGDQRITAHEEVKKNVMHTVYSSGSEIYVNYNNEAVSVGGIIIDPMGFVRVN